MKTVKYSQCLNWKNVVEERKYEVAVFFPIKTHGSVCHSLAKIKGENDKLKKKIENLPSHFKHWIQTMLYCD